MKPLRNPYNERYYSDSPSYYFKSVQREVTLKLDGKEYGVWMDVNLKLWPEHHQLPEIERMWPVDITDYGGHTVRDKELCAKLQAAALDWAKEHLDDLVDQVEKENRE